MVSIARKQFDAVCYNQGALILKCFWCNEEINGEPYATKEYPSIDRRLAYHTKCFVIAHRGQLDE